MNGSHDESKRSFLRRLGLGGLALGLAPLAGATPAADEPPRPGPGAPEDATSMIGAYGLWASRLAGEAPPALSFRNPAWSDLGSWRAAARTRLLERLAMPPAGSSPRAEVVRTGVHDGLRVEELSWELGYGPPTRAILLKPEGAAGRLPGVVALHDHGGNKYFGRRKLTRTDEPQHPLMRAHQEQYYGGRPWANELARRGYVVLVPDAFAFASRRVLLEDVPARLRGETADVRNEEPAEIEAYNRWAGSHEAVMAKSLFSAGTTWPGVCLHEDQRAVDLLCARDDVDPERVGCAGLSGGGLRTVFLAGLDPRIRCAVSVGMMTTWRDYLLEKSFTHTWMVYVPVLPRELDYPEMLGLRVPLPTLVQSNLEDSLFTLPEMRRADAMLAEIFTKAGAADRYRGTFYPGGHKFDVPMQEEAFAWFDRWLG